MLVAPGSVSSISRSTRWARGSCGCRLLVRVWMSGRRLWTVACAAGSPASGVAGVMAFLIDREGGDESAAGILVLAEFRQWQLPDRALEVRFGVDLQIMAHWCG